MENSKRFDSVLYALSDNLKNSLSFIPADYKNKIEEIRLRTDKPITITINGEVMFIKTSSIPTKSFENNLLCATKNDMDITFKRLCKNSLYQHMNELKNGYIMMDNGHRAGVCGVLTENGMRDISSINIRIAREIKGCARKIIAQYKGGGILIAGPPASGKTTILRDLIRQLSNGYINKMYRITVIDSRGELSGTSNGKAENDLGLNTDILYSENKAVGLEIAIRTMFPNIVAFDEIGTIDEFNAISYCFSSGVDIITTVHIGDENDLYNREITKRLIKSNVFNTFVILNKNPSESFKIISQKEMLCGVAV